MRQFSYRAALSDGRIQRGLMDAGSEQELNGLLQGHGLQLIEAHEKKNTPLRLITFSTHRLTISQRQQFYAQLADLLDAGVKLPDALQSLLDSEPEPLLRDTILRVVSDIRQGTTVHRALTRTPWLANPVQAAIVMASEQDNLLAPALRQIASQLAWQQTMQKLLQRGLRYPLFLLFVAFGVTAFMLAVVVPQVLALLQTLATDLPLATRLLIAGSEFFLACWWMIPLGLIVLALTIRLLYQRSPRWALRLDDYLLRLPVAGRIVRHFALARYCHNIAALISSGMRLPDSLAIATEVIGNRALQQEAAIVRTQILSGISFAAAMRPLLGAAEHQMLLIGEQSGQWTQVLERISQHYATTMQRRIETLINALEPTLTLMVGGLLAWVVLAVLGPVYGSLNVLSGQM